MESIIAKINDLYAALLQKSQSVEIEKGELNRKQIRLNNLTAECELKAADLATREAACKAIEDVVALKVEANRLKKEAQSERMAAQKAKDDLQKTTQASKQELAELRAEIQHDRTLGRKEADLLVADRKALTKDRAELKDKLMKELRVKIGA